ncbi:MAG: hypothetical protein KDE28_04520 [Anaerolineales bacterium]|nr:hypothetical protein [Anaerolineales bacterium]
MTVFRLNRKSDAMRERALPVVHRYRPLFILLIWAALALFLYRIDGQSFWRDEALSVLRARQDWLSQWQNQNVIDGVASPDLHPPLYFLLLTGWRSLLGESEFSYRLFSLFSQLLGLATLARLTKAMGSGALSWTLALLSPFLWWYAQEARMYALMFWLGTLILLLLWRLLQVEKPGRYQYAAILGLLLLLTLIHYSGGFLLAFVLMVFLWRLRPSWSLIALAGGLLLVVVVAIVVVLDQRLFTLTLTGLTPAAWFRILNESVRTFSLGSAQAAFHLRWELLPFLTLFVVSLVQTVKQGWEQGEWRPLFFTSGGFLLLSLIFAAGSIVQVTFGNPRHFTLLAPFWFLALAHGVRVIWGWYRPVALALFLLCSFFSFQALQTAIQDPPQIRDDMRGLAHYLDPLRQPGDVIVFHDAAMMAIYEIYALPELPARAIPAIFMSDDTLIRQSFYDFTAGHDRVWVVTGLMGPTGVIDILRHEWVKQNSVSFPASWSGLHLALYTRPLASTELPPVAEPLAESLSLNNIDIVGIGAIPVRGQVPGQWWSVYWTEPAGAAGADSNVCLRLRDPEGTVWSESCQQLSDARPFETQAIYERVFWLPYPTGLPPLTYSLELGAGDQVVLLLSKQIAATLAPGAESPLLQGEQTDLWTFEWAAPDFRAGAWALGNFIWQAGASIDQEPMVRIRLVDWLGRSVAETMQTLGPDSYPPAAWSPGQLVRQPLALSLPFTLAGRYRLQINLPGTDDWQTVASTTIVGWPKLTELPEGIEPVAEAFTFGDTIELLAYTSEQQGDDLHLTLYWRSANPPPEDYIVFIHLAEAGQPPLAQTSSGPANWTRPVSSWRPDEIIVDQHTIVLPSPLPANAALWVGLYSPADPNSRLPAAQAGGPLPNQLAPLGRPGESGP